MDFWYLEYEKFCEKCNLLEILPIPFDKWLKEVFSFDPIRHEFEESEVLENGK